MAGGSDVVGSRSARRATSGVADSGADVVGSASVVVGCGSARGAAITVVDSYVEGESVVGSVVVTGSSLFNDLLSLSAGLDTSVVSI